jgi:uncharacterized protein (UPF0261 family)
MVETEVPPGDDRPLIAASMFGNTTPAVERARAGYEAGAVGSALLAMEVGRPRQRARVR